MRRDLLTSANAHFEIWLQPHLAFHLEFSSAVGVTMPTIQFCHEMTAISSYRSLAIDLQVTHTIDILTPSPNAIKTQASSLPWLQTVEFGSELDLTLSCVIEGTPVLCRHLRTFPFVSDILKALREVRGCQASQALTLSLPLDLL